MSNEITTKNCLEAELLLGYQCFRQKELLEKEIEGYWQKKTQQQSSYENTRNRNIYSANNLAKVKTQYKLFCEQEKSLAVGQNIRKIDEEKRYIQAKIEEIEKNIKKCKAFFGWGALSLGHLSPVLAIRDYRKQIKQHEEQLQKLEESKKQDVAVKHTPFDTFLHTHYSKRELIAEYEANHQAELLENDKRQQELDNQIAKLNEGVASMEKIIQSVTSKLQELPPYYFQKDAIVKMLFFYVNKRADNVRDLINLYETTVFQEALLHGLQNISISVDRLSENVIGGFKRLGLQLGVIHDSIQENTAIQKLNYEKLSEIKDDNARHYMETVNTLREIEDLSKIYITSNIAMTMQLI